MRKQQSKEVSFRQLKTYYAVNDDTALEQASDDGTYVSVVIPCYNEERYIGTVLENLADQYEAERYEIIVVDGMSEDRTREVISRFKALRPDIKIRLVDNPAGNIPAALNLGIAEARGDIIVRMDAHSIASKNYVRRCVEVMRRGNTAVVGMPWRICPGADTLTARAIALAVAHPFGIGDAKYRLNDALATEQLVDTVPFGSFRKDLWRELGGFNEDLLANEDYDFNYRVRLQGGRVILDPSEHCAYFARATLGDLATQYFRYGNWKAQMIKLHPRSIRWRQLVAPLFVASLVLLTALGLWWSPAWWLLLLIVVSYSSLALVCAFQLSRKGGSDARLMLMIPLVFFTIHFMWGSSFLLGMVRSPRR